MEGKKSLLATPLACMIPTCVYLDYNATTPIFPEVCDEMLPFLHTHFGNPSSIHAYAMPCSLAIDVSRERVRKALGATNGKKEIVFTSCGTESDNRAIDIACDLFNSSASSDEATCVLPHVISTAVEHPAVLVYLESERKAKRLTYSLVPVNEEGAADVGVRETVGGVSRQSVLRDDYASEQRNGRCATGESVRRFSESNESENFGAHGRRAVVREGEVECG